VCPHEIGIFIGYPINDVKCFVDCDKECIAVGYWKVYENIEYAMACFQSFDDIKSRYADLLSSGYSPLRAFRILKEAI
jgi:hypothetical protein